MKSGCSLSSAGASCIGEASSMSASQRWSRPSMKFTAWPVRVSITTCSTEGQPPCSVSASSTAPLSSTILPRRQPPSAVTMTLAVASFTRSRIACAEKPPKMMLWVAPIRAQASIATDSSGTIGM